MDQSLLIFVVVFLAFGIIGGFLMTRTASLLVQFFIVAVTFLIPVIIFRPSLDTNLLVGIVAYAVGALITFFIVRRNVVL